MPKETNILAGDIGGTKSLLAIYSCTDKFIPQKIYQKRYSSREWNIFEDIIVDFIDNMPNKISKPKLGCLGIAGPVINEKAKITNLNWQIEKYNIVNIAKLKELELINDFSVIFYGIPYLNDQQYICLQENTFKSPPTKNNGLVAVIGAGTGLGVSRGLISNKKIDFLPSEGGHREFAPRTQQEWDFSLWLKKDLNINRISVERVVSGSGIGRIARWMLLNDEEEAHPLRKIALDYSLYKNEKDFSSLASEYASKGDQLMQKALKMWLSAYGSAAGDVALQELCYGGLWIGGGSTAKQIEGVKSPTFLEAFRNKGRFEQFLKNLPLMAFVDPEIGLFSAACRGHMLAISNEKINER